MNNINFDNPWLLFLAIPLLLAVIIPFAVTVRGDNANFHNIASCVLHVIICICITLVISGMSLEKVITETNVYVLADISYSANHNLDEVQENLDKVSDKLPKNSKMGVICFGRNYQLISDMGAGVPDVSSADKVDRSATDIASALRYAGNLFDDGVIKRIIVITDGAETVTSNNILKVVSALQDSGIYVDAIYLDDNIDEQTKEIQIDGIEATSSTYVGKEEQVNVLVRANVFSDGETSVESRIDGYVNLYMDGERVERRTASFYNGLNVVILPLSTENSGIFSYEVTVEALKTEDDSSPYNNSYLFSQTVSDERKVLFLGGTDADISAGMSIYGVNDVTYITQANANKVPLTVEQLCVFDEIVMSNFDVRSIVSYTIFFNSLTTLVDDYGKSLTTFGNTYIQEDNGDASNEALGMLAKLLPVNIGNFEQEDRLVAIVLDISTSMNFSSRLAIAKRAAIELLNSLNSNDMVMVIGFSGGVTQLLPPTKLTSVNTIIKAINECEVENETYLSAALELTMSLMPTRYRNRQVFLISDGNNHPADEASAKNAVTLLHQSDVVVSALGIYPDAYGDGLLQAMISNGDASKGSFYKKITVEADIDFTIQSITEEAKKVKFEASDDDFNDYYSVKTERPDESVLEDIDSIGAIYGFWSSGAKSKTVTVLSVTYMRDMITEIDVPLYAYWSPNGKGRVYSFLSDITSGWTAGWTENSGGRKFLSAVPFSSLPDERIATPFFAEISTSINNMTVYVNTSSSLQEISAFEITVTDPEGIVTTKNLTLDSGLYFANFISDTVGTYSINIKYSFNGIEYEAETEYTVSYSPEYDSFASFSKSSLYRLLTANGSIIELDEIERLENNDSNYTTYIFSFTMPLMIVCAVLFMADIIIRHLRWKDVTSFFKGMFRRRK